MAHVALLRRGLHGTTVATEERVYAETTTGAVADRDPAEQDDCLLRKRSGSSRSPRCSGPASRPAPDAAKRRGACCARGSGAGRTIRRTPGLCCVQVRLRGIGPHGAVYGGRSVV